MEDERCYERNQYRQDAGRSERIGRRTFGVGEAFVVLDIVVEFADGMYHGM